MLKKILFQWFVVLLLTNIPTAFGQEEPTGLIVKVNHRGLQFGKFNRLDVKWLKAILLLTSYCRQ